MLSFILIKGAACDKGEKEVAMILWDAPGYHVMETGCGSKGWCGRAGIKLAVCEEGEDPSTFKFPTGYKVYKWCCPCRK